LTLNFKFCTIPDLRKTLYSIMYASRYYANRTQGNSQLERARSGRSGWLSARIGKINNKMITLN